jgi:hypothetical protein
MHTKIVKKHQNGWKYKKNLPTSYYTYKNAFSKTFKKLKYKNKLKNLHLMASKFMFKEPLT